MHIELLNYGNNGCKAKCPTCPQMISGPHNGPYTDLMFEALNRVKKQFSDEPIGFSFQNDIADLPDELEKLSFDIGNIDYDIGCNIKIPFDTKIVANVFKYLEARIPNVQLALFLENRGLLSDYKIGVFNIIDIFVNSKINNLAIACHNNSMRIKHFDQNIDRMFEGNTTMFKEVLDTYRVKSFQKTLDENLIPFPPKNYKQFISSLNVALSSKNLYLSERILSFENNTDKIENLIDFYRDHFANELKLEAFKKESIGLTFTSIGVRVKHRSIDIRNPYLWFSYDEFFELLEKSEKLEDLCANLEASMVRTGFLSLKIKEISYKTIDILSNARRNLVIHK